MYDLLVLSFSQSKAEQIDVTDVCVQPLNKYGRKTKKYYHEIWPFINNAYGILYKIYTADGLGEFECCDDLFEFDNVKYSTNELAISNLITVENVADNDCVCISPLKTQGDALVSVLKKLISFSPISSIAFLCRGQSIDKEVIIGTICAKDFYAMLYSGKVKTNICYIIRDEARDENN